jgi:hypothetical protein
MKKSVAVAVGFLLFASGIFAQAIKVEVRETKEGFTLFREGKPYYIQGVGGKEYVEEMLYLGANSIRTWGIDEADEALATAEKHGLTVMLGLWVQHERHGFDYNDEAAVQRQLERFTQIVKKYKDHPSILLWGVGNEVDLFYTNTKVWDAIQDIAKMIHEVDPNHPTCTVTAGLDSNEVYEVMKRAPDIDIYGFNTYGDIERHSNNIRRYGWEGPYIISEWGPNGHWEVEKTAWNAPIEQTSTEKAASYKHRYKSFIEAKKGECIGSYVFLWGQKQETTSTWYGLFTTDGNPTEPLDYLYVAWNGKQPPNRAPSVSRIKLNGKEANESIYLRAGDKYTAEVTPKDPDGDKIRVEWLVFPESQNTKSGGDFEDDLQPVLGVLSKRKGESATLVAPKKEGAYRLFVFITDKENRTAYANIPFYVNPRNPGDPPAKKVRFKKKTLEVNRNR